MASEPRSERVYSAFTRPLRKSLFTRSYPESPTTSVERVRKARINTRLLMREPVEMLGVTWDVPSRIFSLDKIYIVTIYIDTI